MTQVFELPWARGAIQRAQNQPIPASSFDLRAVMRCIAATASTDSGRLPLFLIASLSTFVWNIWLLIVAWRMKSDGPPKTG